jgi:hypothetical protein
VHVFSFLFLIIISGKFAVTSLPVCTAYYYYYYVLLIMIIIIVVVVVVVAEHCTDWINFSCLCFPKSYFLVNSKHSLHFTEEHKFL